MAPSIQPVQFQVLGMDIGPKPVEYRLKLFCRPTLFTGN